MADFLPIQAPVEPGHSPWGASSSDRWLNCPGSVEAHAAAPKPAESDYAAEGNVAHDLLEQTMRGRLNNIKLMALVGSIIEYHGVKVKVTEEMVDGVLLHFNTVLEDFNRIKAMGKPAPIQMLIEHRVVASSVDPKAFGTLDSGIAQKGNILIIHDFKYGQGKLVEAVNNPQGLQYLISVIDTLLCEAFDEIWFVVVQPRMAHSEGRVRRWKVTREQLQAHREKMIKGIAATKVPNAPRAAGKWCRWCNAYAGCPQARAMVQAETAMDFATVGQSVPAPKIANPDELTPELMARAMEYEEIITKWFKAVREVAQAKLERGETVPGYKLVEGRSNRVWKDEEEVKKKFEDIYGDGIYKPKTLRTPADLEVVVGKKVVAELSMKPAGKKTIAPDSDYRASTTSSAASDFKNVPLNADVASTGERIQNMKLEADLGDLL